MPDSKTISSIPAPDWDFLDADASRKSIHSFHSYPARFIPEIPRRLIEELPPPKGTLVLDPFCGCGTVLVEAKELGLPSCGIDLNPIACLLARVKTTKLPPTFPTLAHNCTLQNGAVEKPTWLNSIPNLAHWFQPHVTRSLANIVSRIELVTDPVVRDGLKAAFSSIVVRVSNQDSDTRYAAVEKTVTEADVTSYFLEAAETLFKLSHSTRANRVPVTVINQNIFTITPQQIPGRVGLVITSPPYPNAYEYWLYHKYRMWWLGYDPLAVKKSEIGARAHFFTSRHKDEDFGKQMSGVLALIQQTLAPGGHCCFIVGPSRIHGRIVDNSAILEEQADRLGFTLLTKVERSINSNRKSFNLHHARIKTEHVLVWRLNQRRK